MHHLFKSLNEPFQSFFYSLQIRKSIQFFPKQIKFSFPVAGVINSVPNRAVVVAQLEERLLPIPELHSFESSHQQNFYWTFIYCQLYWKDKNKEKEAENGLFINSVPNN